MAAAFTGLPELRLVDEEAKMLADGMADVQRHYGIIVGDKNIAWANLAIALGAVYGPRFMVIRAKMAERNQPTKTSASSNVVPIANG